MRTWILLISTSIHGFLQNLPVQARGRSPGQSSSCFYILFWDLAGWKTLETMYYPKGKFAREANTMALNNAINVASQILK